MSKTINCIMLVDDNPDDNFFHERVIRKSGFANTVISKKSGEEALDYLIHHKDNNDIHPDLIFLDINMPGMNGWEFLEEYKNLNPDLKSDLVVVMLTTSQDPDDRTRAINHPSISDFKTKPISKEMLDEVINKNY